MRVRGTMMTMIVRGTGMTRGMMTVMVTPPLALLLQSYFVDLKLCILCVTLG